MLKILLRCTALLGLLMLLGITGVANMQDIGADELWLRWSPDGERLIYTSNRTGQKNVYLMDANGENSKLLIEDFTWRGLEWSSDGRYVAFSAGEAETLDLYLLEVDTGEIMPVAENEFANWFRSWSPDGKLLHYTEEHSDGSRLKLYSLEDQRSYALIDEPLDSNDSIWSPDGRQIAIRRYDYDTKRHFVYIYDMQTATMSADLLAGLEQGDEGCCDHGPVWSPDGKMLAYAIHPDPYIYGIDLQTLAIEKLVETNAAVSRFKWLADGRLLYLTGWNELEDADGSTLPGVYMASPGETPQLVAEGYGTQMYVSPDEKHMLLQNFLPMTIQGRKQPRALELIDLVTFEITEVDVFDYNSFDIAWSPDSTRIAASLCVADDADIYIIDGVTAHATNITPDDLVTGEPRTTECSSFG
jgi:Tol biopolymer transport system component